jgi:hypothetical protein
MSQKISLHRRQLFGIAAGAIAAARFGAIGAANAKTRPAQWAAIKPGTNTSFSSLKQINAGSLNVGYA